VREIQVRIGRMLRLFALALVALAVGLGVAACGGDDDSDVATTEETTTEGTTTEETSAVGREIFVANCGTCHTLSDAGTSGAIGPQLDGLDLSSEAVEEQVRNGGGAMPAFEDTLSDEEIQEVAAYVAASSGG
jgi:mono/diheme cytochrome c family protein